MQAKLYVITFSKLYSLQTLFELVLAKTKVRMYLILYCVTCFSSILLVLFLLTGILYFSKKALL